MSGKRLFPVLLSYPKRHPSLILSLLSLDTEHLRPTFYLVIVVGEEVDGVEPVSVTYKTITRRRIVTYFASVPLHRSSRIT